MDQTAPLVVDEDVLSEKLTEEWITFLSRYPGYRVSWTSELGYLKEVRIDHHEKMITFVSPV